MLTSVGQGCRLPLHLASDPTALHVLKKNTRYELVYDIWKAYPEAASVVDPLTGLPPFAMAARDPDEGKEFDFKVSVIESQRIGKLTRVYQAHSFC
jgi:hypothetical protein